MAALAVTRNPFSVAPPVPVTNEETVEWEADFEWREHAVCKGRIELFFGPRAERPQARARREAAARRICGACPVLNECRDWARNNHEFGFWGGESEDQRHFLGFHVSAPIGVRARQRQIDSENRSGESSFRVSVADQAS